MGSIEFAPVHWPVVVQVWYICIQLGAELLCAQPVSPKWLYELQWDHISGFSSQEHFLVRTLCKMYFCVITAERNKTL